MTGRAAIRAPLMWAQALALGFCLALAPALTVLCLALLLPGIAAWYLDSAHGRPMGRTVLAFGAAGAFAPVWRQVQHDPTMHGLLAEAVDVRAFGFAWGLAGIGWLIGRAAQLAIAIHHRTEANSRIRHLKARRHALETEWDFGPR